MEVETDEKKLEEEEERAPEMLPSDEDVLLGNMDEELDGEGGEEINEDALLAEEEEEEQGEEYEEGMIMDEEEFEETLEEEGEEISEETMENEEEEEDQFPDSNADNDFPEDEEDAEGARPNDGSDGDSRGSSGGVSTDGQVVHRTVVSGSRDLRREVHMRHKFTDAAGDRSSERSRNYYTPKGMSQSPYKGAYQCPYCPSVYSFRGDLFKHLRRKHHGKEPLVRSGQIPVLDLKSGKCEPIRAPPRQYKSSAGSKNYRLFASYKAGYSFSSKPQPTQASNFQNPKVKFKCPLCANMYLFKANLNKHCHDLHFEEYPKIKSGEIKVQTVPISGHRRNPPNARNTALRDGKAVAQKHPSGIPINGRSDLDESEDLRYKCPLCTMSYTNKTNLIYRHIRQTHPNQYEAVKAGSLKIKILRARSGAIMANASAKLAHHNGDAKVRSSLNSLHIFNATGRNRQEENIDDEIDDEPLDEFSENLEMDPTSSAHEKGEFQVGDRVFTPGVKYKCPFCPQMYSLRGNLTYRHMKQAHPAKYYAHKAGRIEMPIRIIRGATSANASQTVEKTAPSGSNPASPFSQLAKNLSTVTGNVVGETDTNEVLYKCPICSFTSGSREYLISRHIKDRHPSRFDSVKSGFIRIKCLQSGREVDSIRYQCPGCSKSMASKRALLHKHIKHQHPGMTASITAGIIEIKAIGRRHSDGQTDGLLSEESADDPVEDADFSVDNPYFDTVEEEQAELTRPLKRKTLPSSAVPQQGMELSLEGTIQPMPDDFSWKVRGCDVMYKCPLCPRMNMFRGNLLRYHMTREHPGSREAVLAGTLQVRRVLVQRSFNTRAPSESHHTPLASSAIDIDGFRFKCPFCNSTYANMWDLLHKHMYTYHPQHQDDCKRGNIEIPVCTDADVGGRHKTWKGLPGPDGKGFVPIDEDGFEIEDAVFASNDMQMEAVDVAADGTSSSPFAEDDDYEDYVPEHGGEEEDYEELKTSASPTTKSVLMTAPVTIPDTAVEESKQKKPMSSFPAGFGVGPKGGVPRQAPTGQVFSCKYCGVGYHWASNIRRHCLKHHKAEYEAALERGEPSYVVTNTDKQTGEELTTKIRCLDCHSLMGNHMAMKKHISVHHVYLFNKEYTSGAETGVKEAGDRQLRCHACRLYFEGEFGLANHYSREHFDLIREGDASGATPATAENDADDARTERTSPRNLEDDIRADAEEGARRADEDVGVETSAGAASSPLSLATEEDAKCEEGDDATAESTKLPATTTPTPRRSSRQALRNRAPSIETRDSVSKTKKDGNERTGHIEDSEEHNGGEHVAAEDEAGDREEPQEGKGGVKEEGEKDSEGPEAKESVEITPAKRGGLQCPLCPSSCNYRSLLLNHIKKYHPVDGEHYWKELMQERYKCPLCTAIYKNDFDLPRHIKKIHPKYFRPNATITYKPLSKPPEKKEVKEEPKEEEAVEKMEAEGDSNSSIEGNEDRNLEIADDDANDGEDDDDDERGEEGDGGADDSMDDVGGVRFPEEIEGVSVNPNDKTNPPPPLWHDPKREGLWVHYKVKEEGKIERLWVYMVPQSDGTCKYQCPTCPAIYSHKHDVPKHIRRKHRVTSVPATPQLSAPFTRIVEEKKDAELNMSTDVVDGSDSDSPGRSAQIQSSPSSDYTHKCLYCSFVSTPDAASMPDHIEATHPSFYDTFIQHIWPKILADSEKKAKNPKTHVALVRAAPKSVKERQGSLPPGEMTLTTQQSSLIGRFECPSCFSTYGTYSNVVRHIKSKHPLQIQELVKDIMVYESVSAEEAGLSPQTPQMTQTTQIPQIKDSSSSDSGGVLLLNCSICNLEFISDYGLKKHVDDAHPDASADNKLLVLARNGEPRSTIGRMPQPDFDADESITFVDEDMGAPSPIEAGAYIVPEMQYGGDISQSLYCAQCNVSFKHRKYLMAHIRKKHPDRRYVCNACPAMFKSHQDLMAHQKDHHSNLKFKCSHCNMNYKSSKGLFAHLKTMHPNAPSLKDFNSGFYESDRLDTSSPEFGPGRDLDLEPQGLAAPASTATLAILAPQRPSFGESVFAGGTYELEHPVNHLGNDVRNEALSEDSGYPGLRIDKMTAIKEEMLGSDGAAENDDYPLPTLASLQSGLRHPPPQREAGPLLSDEMESSGTGGSALMLRSLLTGGGSGGVGVPTSVDVVGRNSPVDLDSSLRSSPDFPNEDNRSAEAVKIPQKLKCADCPFVTSVTVIFHEHNRMHHNVTEFRCPHCSFSSPIREELVQHQLLHFGSLLLATSPSIG